MLVVLAALLWGAATAPHANAADPWTRASLPPDTRASLLLGAMTQAEKFELMANDPDSPYAYYNAPIERVGIPALKMLDAGSGLRLGGVTVPGTENRATAMPSTMLLAASFDPKLATLYGRTVGQEVRSAGSNILLGPNADIVRQPWWGRANEAESEDPFLTAEMVVPYIKAVQRLGVVADLKHYGLYTQELNRCCGSNVQTDERAIHEIYLPAWEAAVKRADLGSTMCAFNKVDGQYACESRTLLADLLRKEVGFKGFVLSDFGAGHDTVDSLNNGLDMETGRRSTYTPETLQAALDSGDVTQATIDTHVRRILRTMFKFGLFDQDDATSPIDVDDHAQSAREIAAAGITLLKNDNAALPLNGRSTKSIAVIGADANAPISQGGASHVTPTRSVSILDGLRDRAPSGVDVEWAPGSDQTGATSMLPGGAALPSSVLAPSDGSGEQGLHADYFGTTDLTGDPIVSRTEPTVAYEQGFMGGSPAFASLYGSHRAATPADAGSVRYSGTFTAPADGDYTLTLSGFGDAQVQLDGALAVDMTGQDGPRTVTSATLALQAGEPHELTVEYRATRPFVPRLEGGSLKLAWTHPSGAYTPSQQDAAELAADSDVAVVVASTFETEQRDRATLTLPENQDQLIRAVSAANPNTIVVLATPGPVTMPWLTRVPGVVQTYYAGQEQGDAVADVLFGDVDPSGKLPVTYPRSDAQAEQLGTKNPWAGLGSLDVPFSEGVFVGYRGYDAKDLEPLFPFGYGLSYTTFDYGDGLRVRRTSGGGLRVTYTITNTGRRTGAEASQVYVGKLPTSVPTPPRQLAGFAKVRLRPGESRTVSVDVSKRSLSYWDSTGHAWKTPSGRLSIAVGGSSRDLPLERTVSVGGGGAPAGTPAPPADTPPGGY